MTPEVEEVMENLRTVIKGLSDRERIMLTLYYYENQTMKEIAPVMNCSIEDVSQIHQKILKALKSKLEEYEK